MFKALFSGLGKIASGRAQQSLGVQSPLLASGIVRLGRFFYIASGAWIAVTWYSAYVNMHTQPGSGPTLVLPGSRPILGGPTRPERTPAFAQNLGGGGTSTTMNPGIGGGRNPAPGAVGTRLDQGFDMTLGPTGFLAPADSVIVYSSQSVAGWKGGGLIAGKILSGPKAGMVWYSAEGISPVAQVGDRVTAGQRVGIRAINPYNGVLGNIEAGWANPSSPTQPLAQVSNNPKGVAWDFYNWFRSLGGPKASSTGNAGFP